MKCYVITVDAAGRVRLLCQSLDKKGKLVETRPDGAFDIGSLKPGTRALAICIMLHYMGASTADPGATLEAEARAERFQHAFLSHAKMKLGATLEITSDVIDRFFALPG